MGKKIRISDIFNYINSIYVHISIRCRKCSFWFLLLIANSIIIYLPDYFFKKYPYDCQIINTERNVNIDECNYFIEFISEKYLHSKEILFYLWVYHILFASIILLNDKFHEFYKIYGNECNIANGLIYFISSFIHMEFILVADNPFEKVQSSYPTMLFFVCLIYVLFELTLPPIIMLMLCVLIVGFVKKCFNLYEYILSFCYNLYDEKIKNIAIIELPNELLTQMEKNV